MSRCAHAHGGCRVSLLSLLSKRVMKAHTVSVVLFNRMKSLGSFGVVIGYALLAAGAGAPIAARGQANEFVLEIVPVPKLELERRKRVCVIPATHLLSVEWRHCGVACAGRGSHVASGESRLFSAKETGALTETIAMLRTFVMQCRNMGEGTFSVTYIKSPRINLLGKEQFAKASAGLDLEEGVWEDLMMGFPEGFSCGMMEMDKFIGV